jgi:hypothetical protein
MPNDNNSEEERFARQDQQPYSGWSSVTTIAIIAFVIGIFVLMYLRH